MLNRLNTRGRRILSFIGMVLACFCLHSMHAQEKNVSWKNAQHQDSSWYGSKEAIRIADNVLLYQHNNGGWLKNIAMAKMLGEKEKQIIIEEKSKPIGTTIDNGATHTQLRYLARVYDQTEKDEYKKSFLKGVDYLLDAQYENGGWPQFYPTREGYYEHITFNDNAMIGVMFLLRDTLNEESFGFVDIKRRDKINEALRKAEKVILKMQIRIDGKPTLWCAQHHSKDLSPAKARSYELPSLSGSESVGIVKYLMGIENPSHEVKTAVKTAISWFEEHKIIGKKVTKIDAPNLPGGRDRVVVEDKEGDPLWARFNEIGTGRPMFVGRDGIVEDALHKIEHERRMGYSYLGNYAGDLLSEDYPNWLKRISKN